MDPGHLLRAFLHFQHFRPEIYPESDQLINGAVAPTYSVIGITLSGAISVCPGAPKIIVRVFPPGDEPRFMENVKPPPLGLDLGNTSRSWAENDINPGQEEWLTTITCEVVEVTIITGSKVPPNSRVVLGAFYL